MAPRVSKIDRRKVIRSDWLCAPGLVDELVSGSAAGLEGGVVDAVGELVLAQVLPPSSKTRSQQPPKLIAWLGGHPEGTLYLKPTPARFLNAVGGFFVILIKPCLKRDFVKDTVERFVVDHNQHPKPLVWTADSPKIIASAALGPQSLVSIPYDNTLKADRR